MIKYDTESVLSLLASAEEGYRGKTEASQPLYIEGSVSILRDDNEQLKNKFRVLFFVVLQDKLNKDVYQWMTKRQRDQNGCFR